MLVTNIESNIYIALLTTITFLLVASIALICYLFKSRRRNYILKKANDEATKSKMNLIASAVTEAANIKLNAENEVKTLYEKLAFEENLLQNKKDKLYGDLEILLKKEELLLEDKLKLSKTKNELELERKKTQLLLENIANLSEDEVKNELLNLIENKYLTEFSDKVKTSQEKLIKTSQEKAAEILIDAMQSVYIEVTSEKNTTFFEIENDTWKGKIIGKEGRNIKTFQVYGEVDIIIDETPNRITISSFNPLRREIAYQTLQELTKTGRINPASIEEQILIQENKLGQQCYKTGNEIVENLAIENLPDEIIKMLGSLKYRYSYGQNVLQHSIEVATISKKIAQKLGLDEKISQLAGLLHDIGKAVDFEQDGSHVTLGINVLKKYNLDEVIINAVESHHNDVQKESFIAEIVSMADAISAARPGARNNDADEYFARMQELEDICMKQNGVTKAFVLKAGREIRVMVDPNIIDDYSMTKLTFNLKEAIQKNNKTPGDIYIIVIREKRETIKL